MLEINSPKQLQNYLDLRKGVIVEEAKARAEETARKEISLADFELLYASVVDKDSSKKNCDLILSDQKDRWEKALKLAGGDEEKALFIYDDVP